MVWFCAALAILLTSGFLALLVGRFPKTACWIGVLGALGGGGVVLYQSVRVLVSGESQALHLPWPLPMASANMEIDPLSAVFAMAIAVVTMFASVFGGGYLQAHLRHVIHSETAAAAKKPHRAVNLGASWFFFNLLTASMLLVVAARNGVLFLVSWELMSLASFFLVTLEDKQESVRRAGWIYLIAMHLGTAFLLAMFLLLGKNAGSLDFSQFSIAADARGTIFLLALIGFGTKAGFLPMHVWLPEAHPAAPSHVSAVMSGVMIKTGIYGLLRAVSFLGEPEAWWGWTLLGVGVASAIFGVLYALLQKDLKRLLAYCSVENVGIIAIGLGVGLLGVHYGNPAMAILGFTGGLLHVLNHAVFKSLLFLGAGSVLNAAGAGEIDRLGGLLKRMPVTGSTFLIGAAAICGLPPLNGFVSEFLIYLGALASLSGDANAASPWPLLSVLVVGGLALIGGLAIACFTKAAGIAFLGEPRSNEASRVREAGFTMRWPMIGLAGLCVLIGLTAPLWPIVLQPAVAVVATEQMHANLQAGPLCPLLSSREARTSPLWETLATTISPKDGRLSLGPLMHIMFGSYIVLGLVVFLVSLRRGLLANRRVEQAETWGCGYVAPTPRVQYTGSSFVQPLALLFRLFLQPRDEAQPPHGLFPTHAKLHTHTPDLFRRFIYEPAFAMTGWIASQLHRLQEGHIQVYVLYIALTILVLLIWKLG